MKRNRWLSIVALGGVFAIVFFVLIMAIVYARCLVEGLVFKLEVVWPTAFKNSLFIGFVAILLTAVGGPRPRQPH